MFGNRNVENYAGLQNKTVPSQTKQYNSNKKKKKTIQTLTLLWASAMEGLLLYCSEALLYFAVGQKMSVKLKKENGHNILTGFILRFVWVQQPIIKNTMWFNQGWLLTWLARCKGHICVGTNAKFSIKYALKFKSKFTNNLKNFLSF